jgi:hypothetical protein
LTQLRQQAYSCYGIDGRNVKNINIVIFCFCVFETVSVADGEENCCEKQPPTSEEERDTQAEARQLPDVAMVNDSNADDGK